ncbi:MAG: hypothetical protein KJ749_10735 [Planctomycetes bacterium]|nr:hypothetical protein [Planctomycetota bacterium]
MAQGKSRLEVEARQKGFDEVAKKAEQVDKSLKGIGKTAEDADDAQKKLTASSEAYVGILARISPALAALVDGFVKGSRIAGDFATQQINLREVLGKARTAIVANAKALASFAAVGLVVAGISAIVAAVRSMREEFERATAAIQKHREALNELAAARLERAKAIETLTDAQKRDTVAIEAWSKWAVTGWDKDWPG